jgi:hypothetical protein
MPRSTRPPNGATDSPAPTRKSTTRGNGASNSASDDDVARRAYEIYQNRGGNHGADLDDWLEAERQLKPGRSDDVTSPINARPRKRKSPQGTGL